MKLYQKISRTIQAMGACSRGWQGRHINTIEMIEREYFINSNNIYTKGFIDLNKSTKDKIYIVLEILLPDDSIITLDLILVPSLSWGFDFKIRWYTNNNNQSKVKRYKPLLEEYLEDLWQETLNQEFREF